MRELMITTDSLIDLIFDEEFIDTRKLNKEHWEQVKNIERLEDEHYEEVFRAFKCEYHELICLLGKLSKDCRIHYEICDYKEIYVIINLNGKLAGDLNLTYKISKKDLKQMDTYIAVTKADKNLTKISKKLSKEKNKNAKLREAVKKTKLNITRIFYKVSPDVTKAIKQIKRDLLKASNKSV